MKTLFTRAIFLSMVALFFSYTSCDTVSSNCGPKFENSDNGGGPSILGWTYLNDGTNAIYRKSLKVENVCAEEHVKASFEVGIGSISSLQLPVTIVGWIEALPLFPIEEVVIMDNSKEPDYYTGNVEYGLQQQYGEDPATYWVVLQIMFPSTGVQAQDDDFVSSNISSYLVKTEYFEFQ